MADSKLDREFLRSILTLAAKPAVDHLLMVTDVPLSKDDIRGRPRWEGTCRKRGGSLGTA